MKTVQRIVGSILSYDDVTQVTVKKVEDFKVEIFEGEKYVGRFSYEKTEPLSDLLSCCFSAADDKAVIFTLKIT